VRACDGSDKPVITLVILGQQGRFIGRMQTHDERMPRGNNDGVVVEYEESIERAALLRAESIKSHVIRSCEPTRRQRLMRFKKR